MNSGFLAASLKKQKSHSAEVSSPERPSDQKDPTHLASSPECLESLINTFNRLNFSRSFFYCQDVTSDVIAIMKVYLQLYLIVIYQHLI